MLDRASNAYLCMIGNANHERCHSERRRHFLAHTSTEILHRAKTARFTEFIDSPYLDCESLRSSDDTSRGALRISFERDPFEIHQDTANPSS
jgi:hypothetical protein